MIKTLTDHPYANARVMISHDATAFISYSTTVIVIDNDGWMNVNGLYSMTTRKQIGWFLKEYAPYITYQMAKRCYEDDMIINIHTGEVRPLPL